MKTEYELSKLKSRKNPYASKLKTPVSMRQGWAEAARKLAEQGDDVLLMGEFGNLDDAERVG